MSPVPYCHNPYHYQRRLSREVKVGKVGIGGANPIRVQSMLTCDTMDTRECVKQTLDLVKVGCEIVRITAPTVKDAANLQHIKAELLAAGCDVPLVADIHFKPDAAMEAAQWVEKVRVNPGNFADKKKFAIREYTDDQYEEETRPHRRDLQAARRSLPGPRDRHAHRQPTTARSPTASMNRFGDTPAGMVESAVEFARIARKYGYHDFVFSMKSSNPKVMINAYRLLAARLLELGPDWNYPLHLGVTEAGDGEDGRIKSAIGIGALLADGIGDTIRVSLTEDSVHEIPVARALVALAGQHAKDELPPQQPPLSFDPFVFARRASEQIGFSESPVGGPSLSTRVGATLDTFSAIEHKRVQLGDLFPDFVLEHESVIQVDPRDSKALDFLANAHAPHVVTIADGCTLSPIVAFRYLAAQIPAKHPILLKDTFHPPAPRRETGRPRHHAQRRQQHRSAPLRRHRRRHPRPRRARPRRQRAARLQHPAIGRQPHLQNRLRRVSSCGRTLFNLQTTTAKIRESTNHLKGVKIAIMGCIVNGPGEMADADFGYVGGAPARSTSTSARPPSNSTSPKAKPSTASSTSSKKTASGLMRRFPSLRAEC